MKIITRRVSGPQLIAPFGDVQYSGSDPAIQGGCSIKGFSSHLKWLRTMSTRLGATLSLISVGDHVDLMSPSNREGYNRAGIYSTAKRAISFYFGTIVDELADIVLEYIKPEEVVNVMYGHHWFTYDGGAHRDTEHHLAERFGGVPVVEASVYIEYKFPGTQYNVLAQHGVGNGASLAYGLNKLDKLSGGFEGVHAFVQGHVHKLGAIKKAKLSIGHGDIVHKDVQLVTTGAFLRGWKKDEALYPEVGGMSPLPIGGAAILVEEDDSTPEGHTSVVMLR